jgi:hypothetical protein
MIQINEQTVTVESGKNGKGAIALKASGNILSLRDLKNEKAIGEALEDSDAADISSISIEFHSVESVDMFLAALQVIKRNLLKTGGMYPFAC